MSSEHYPLPGFNFRVQFELDGVMGVDFQFQDIAGLSAEIALETLKRQ